MKRILLRKLSVGLRLPKLVQFSSLQVLHRNDKLLLLWKGKVVEQLHNVFVFELPEGLDLFGDHVGVLV